jgi:polyhydroxybutyrate depolymerase
MRRWTLVTLLCWLAALAVFPVSAQQDENGTLQIDGIERTYYLHVPASYDGTSPVPLIVALHPAASSGRAMALLTGLDAAADENGFIVAYPNTSGPSWGEDASDTEAPDDARFIPAPIDHLAEPTPLTPRTFRWSGGAAVG